MLGTIVTLTDKQLAFAASGEGSSDVQMVVHPT